MKRDLLIYARSSTMRQVTQVNRDSMNRQHKLIDDRSQIEDLYNCEYKQTFSDQGKSAFKAEHLQQGSALYTIIRNAENGLYNQPILYIENWDRLSRLTLSNSQLLINKIFNAGISIIVQKTGIHKLWSVDDQDSISSSIMLSVALWQAHEESKNKSQRLRQTFQNNLEKGTIRSSMNIPSWINFNHETQSYTINEYSPHIHKAFELRLQGMSCLNIARYFNDRNIKLGLSQRTKISETRIKKILTGQQVLGSYVTKGRIIPDFLPRLIDDETFQKVADTFKGKRTKQGQTIHNLFYGLTVCAKCAASYVSVNTSRDDFSLRCSNRARGVDEKSRACSNSAIRYNSIIEPCLRYYFNRVDIKEILKRDDSGIDTTVLQEQIHQQEKLLKKLTNLYLTLEDESFLDKSKQCKTELDRLKNELKQHEKTFQIDSVEWTTIVEHPIKSRNDKIAVNSILRRYIDKIELQAYADKKRAKRGAVAIIHWKSGSVVRLQLPSMVNDPDGYATFKAVWG